MLNIEDKTEYLSSAYYLKWLFQCSEMFAFEALCCMLQNNSTPA